MAGWDDERSGEIGDMSAAVAIRHAGAGDEAAWRELWTGYNSFYGAGVPDAVTAATWGRILDPASPVKAVLAMGAGGAPLGFGNYILQYSTWLIEPVCLLDDLYVRPEARGRGVGRAIIDHLIALSGERGWGRLYWMTREDNAVARRLYDRYTGSDGYVRYTLTFGGVRATGGSAAAGANDGTETRGAT